MKRILWLMVLPWIVQVSTLSIGPGSFQNDDGSLSDGSDLTLVRVLYKGHLHASHLVGPPDQQDEIDAENDFVDSLNQAHERRHPTGNTYGTPGDLFYDKNWSPIAPCGFDDCGKKPQ